MYIRCPQKPFFTPPATAKFALALGSDGETIHPPPVTKSVGVAPQAGGCDGDVGHVMSACACETITSARGGPTVGLAMVTCRALTSMLPDCPLTELDCSLITTVPALLGRTIVWFGASVTVMGWPPLTELIDRLARSELPLTDGLFPLHWAAALDIRKSAVIDVSALPTAGHASSGRAIRTATASRRGHTGRVFGGRDARKRRGCIVLTSGKKFRPRIGVS